VWAWVVQSWVEQKWSDLVNIAGLLISIVGFFFTLLGVWRAKSAAEAAREAASETKEAIVRSDMIADISAVIAMMNEVKRFHREGNWSDSLERYTEIRKKIISLHSTGSNLTDEHKTYLTGAGQQFRDMETLVEKVVAKKKETVDAPRLNKIVSEQVDRLNEILVTLKRNLEK
jgi:hypothetical protein